MSSIVGTGVSDPNITLRFCFITFCGMIALGSILFWKAQLFASADYQEMPVTHQELKIKKQNLLKQKSLQEQLIQTEE